MNMYTVQPQIRMDVYQTRQMFAISGADVPTAEPVSKANKYPVRIDFAVPCLPASVQVSACLGFVIRITVYFTCRRKNRCMGPWAI